MTATAAEPPSILLTVQEAAAQLHVSVPTARRLAAAGHIAKVQVSRGAVRIRRDSVDAFIERGYPRSRPSIQARRI